MKPRPLWPWIVFTPLVLSVLYVLSFGPVCWLAWNGSVDEFGFSTKIYKPIVWCQRRGPLPVASVVEWYIALWAGPGVIKNFYDPEDEWRLGPEPGIETKAQEMEDRLNKLLSGRKNNTPQSSEADP